MKLELHLIYSTLFGSSTIKLKLKIKTSDSNRLRPGWFILHSGSSLEYRLGMPKRLMDSYRSFFAIDEIEASSVLQALHFALLVGFLISFGTWITLDIVTPNAALAGRHVCLPYFQNCEALYFWNASPWSYAQSAWYAFLTGLLCLSGIFAFLKKWTWAHAFLLLPFLWKVFYIFVLTYTAAVDFEYFHIPVLMIYLFAHRKLYFSRRIFVLVYLLAATMKFTESWVVGNYFSSLKLGMPIFPDSLIPLITNGVALFEIISPWFLLSSNRRVRYFVLSAWVLFHNYSIIMVNFTYPSYCLPLLLVLFLSEFLPEDQNPRFSTQELVGWAFMGLLLIVSSLPHFMKGDNLYTLQGLKMGVGMFDANHQCVSETNIHFQDGTQKSNVVSNEAAMKRCGPYPVFFAIKEKCKNPAIAKISWNFLSSVNGGPFYKIVDVPNVCDLTYSALGENSWIKSPSEGAPVIGYPAQNIIQKKSFAAGSIVMNEQQIFLSSTQSFLNSIKDFVISFYWVLWFSVGGYFVLRRLKKLKVAATR